MGSNGIQPIPSNQISGQACACYVGRFVVQFGEGLIFLAGPHQATTGDTEKVCAAFTP